MRFGRFTHPTWPGAVLPGLLVLFVALAAAGRAQDLPTQSTATLDAAIRNFAAANNFNGNVLVERNGQQIYQASFGLADRAFNVPVDKETVFRIASLTKAFTSVLVLELYDEGKIDLDKTIGFYLPDYSGPARDRATLRNLLNHTSGMENFDAGLTSYDDALKKGIEHYQLPFTTDRLISRFCSGKLVNEPGKVFDYNNGEYIILGKIVERVTGKPFDAVLDERILTPLGMKSTGMTYQHLVVRDLAPTYMTTDGGKTFTNDMPVYPENWFASGSMHSTTSDIARFSQSLFAGRLLKPATLDLMLTPGLDGYGYGVWAGTTDFAGKHFLSVNRPGGVMGANGSLRHFGGVGFNESLDIILLSNTNATDMDGFSWMIGKTLLDAR